MACNKAGSFLEAVWRGASPFKTILRALRLDVGNWVDKADLKSAGQ